MAHKDICIGFTLGGQPFEAVGFLEDGEEFVSGDGALRRTDNGQIVRSKEDWRLLYTNRSQLPEKLSQYCLMTAQDSSSGFGIAGLNFDEGAWHSAGYGPACEWYRDRLILRRVVN